MMKRDLLGATAIALMFSVPALAQETPQASEEEAVESTDIIVTASKREQTLQEVPISVSVTSGETIEKSQIRDLIDLQTVVPSLRVSQQQSSANTNFIIRGFGNGANNAGIEPSVGVFIDGVYRSRSAAQIADLPNLKRVEVLRGPQSTLFGKNASAGIISIVTAEPDFDFGGAAELSYGNYNAFVAKANITGPITDNLAFSVAGNYNRRDGYATDLNLNADVSDRNRYGFRGQLLLQASDNMKFRLIADFDQIDENCCAVGNVRSGTALRDANGAVAGPIIAAIGGRLDANNPFSYNVFNNFESINDIKNYGVSLQSDRDFDKFALTTISSYRKVDSKTNQDSDFTSADLIGSNRNQTKIETQTFEARFTSDFDGPLNFLVGGFYFDEKIGIDADLTLGRDFRNYAGGLINPELVANRLAPGSAIISGLEGSLSPFGVQQNSLFLQGQGRFENYKFKNTSYSFFGTVDFKIGDSLTLTGGINYTNDRKRVESNNRSTDVFSTLDLVAFGVPLVTNGAIASNVGAALRGPGGAAATAAEVAAFAGAQPAIFAQIQAGSAAFARSAAGLAANPLLPLRSFQFLPQFLNLPNAVETGRTKDDNVSYTLRAAYEIDDRINVYATYATGFKATSFNLSSDSRPFPADFIAGSPVTNPPASRIRTAGLALPNLTSGTRFAAPEFAETYEAGLKAQFPGFGFNLAVFKQSLKGFQGNTFTGTGFVLTNAGKQSAFGVEFDATVSPVKALNFTYAMTYLKPKFDSFISSPQGDLSGERPAGIPEFAIAIGGNYTHEFESGTKLSLRADFSHQSNVQILDGNPATFLPASFRREVNDLNSSLSLELTNGLEVTLWGRNITNQQYLTSVFPSVAQNGSVSGYASQPRTYGVSGKFKF